VAACGPVTGPQAEQEDAATEPPPTTATKGEETVTTPPADSLSALSEADDGASVSLTVGEEVPIRLANGWVWDQPVVDGDAVTLTQVDYLVDPGFAEWIIEGARPGLALVTAHGEPDCGDVSTCPPTTVRLEFRVSG
jgi:hypothetical protein